MTLSDLLRGFQGYDIFDIEYLRNDTRESYIVTIEHHCKKSHALYRMVTFPMTFSDPNPGFKVTLFFEG